MSKTLYFAAAFCVCALSPLCEAQSGREVSPVIYLSPSEAESSRQAIAALKSAQERNERAVSAWRSFQQVFQAGHPELPNLQFAPDFRIAFTRRDAAAPRHPFNLVAASVELTNEDRQKATGLHQELVDAKSALDKAETAWTDYWHELVADHVTPRPGESAMDFKTAAGRVVRVPNTWVNGIIFSADCRVAVSYF